MRYKACLFLLFSLSLFGVEDIYLKTPNISRDNIIETKVGIRPFRKTGVRIEAEVIKDKVIIHNYGYGGSGLTLCFGGAKEVLDILSAQDSSSKIVAILGAGVAGMAIAYDLLERGYEVHVYSDEWSPNLTSNIAAGIWTPLTFPEDVSEEKKEMHRRMLETSEQRFLSSTGNQPEFAGVCFIDSYRFRSITSEGVARVIPQGEEVLVHFDNGAIKAGRKIQRLSIDGKLFIEDLYSKVRAKGAVLIQRRFEDLEDILSLEEPTIVNCTSMGSRELFNDQEFMPARGQLIHFKQQKEIDFMLTETVPGSRDMWVSIYPWSDRIILGGLHEHGEEEPINTPEIIDRMIKNTEKCLSGQL